MKMTKHQIGKENKMKNEFPIINIRKYIRRYETYGMNCESIIKTQWIHRKLQRLIPNKPPEIIKRKKI